MYGLYHVGYGTGLGDMVFLTGLGVVYAVAFPAARSDVGLTDTTDARNSDLEFARSGMNAADIATLEALT